MGKAKLHTPQEVEVHYILPAVRKALAQQLKDRGLSQKEIARVLNVTEPAVSQYINAKRGNVAFNDVIQEAVKLASQNLTTHTELMAHTQSLLKVIKEQGITCTLCKEITSAPPACRACFE